MLRAETEEQRQYVEEILLRHNIYISWPLDFQSQTDCGFEDRTDAIYLDGDITFDVMSEIVDYLRKK